MTRTIADIITVEPKNIEQLLAQREARRLASIELQAKAQIEKEEYEAAVERRANEIRAERGRGFWQRLVSKLPFVIQRRTT